MDSRPGRRRHLPQVDPGSLDLKFRGKAVPTALPVLGLGHAWVVAKPKTKISYLRRLLLLASRI